MKKETLFTLSIFFVSVVLSTWNITKNEIDHDLALVAVRAAGWYDFLVGEGQTSPVQWFGKEPWWSNLSFHDHPPVSFFMLKISFLLFGENESAVRLPFVFSGISTLLFIFFFLKDFIQQYMPISLLLCLLCLHIFSGQ